MYLQIAAARVAPLLLLLLAALIIAIAVLPVPVRSARGRRVKRIVGGVQAAQPPADDPVVFVRLYGRNARVEGYRDPITGLYSFLGLRFAEPPVGADRFLRPRFRHLRGDINATQYGPPCPQPDGRSENVVMGSEDCLRLNVFSPRLPDESSAGLPVVVFIHGGGFRYGSANQYGPDPLTSKNMIFVPIQYRLGTLGLIGDGSAEFAGNVALFDMAAAVRWVHEYISFFGGDPSQISVIGHGSGATSAVQLSMSDAIDDDMISGVVAMSGSAYTKYAVDDAPAQSVRQIADINGCAEARRDVEILRCLRAVSYADLVRRDSRIQVSRLQGQRVMRSMTGMVGFGPVVERPFDGRSLPSVVDRRPEDKVRGAQFRKVPLLTGVTKHETANCLVLDEIRSVFTTATDFLGQLTKALDLGRLLSVGGNQSLDGLAANYDGDGKVDLLGVGKVLSLTDYLKVPQSLEPNRILGKLTEATTDALFNLPALLSAQAWGKVAPSYLYSFEHAGHQAKGSHFLPGLPIVSKSDGQSSGIVDRVSHGDELGYLFDARDMFGKRIVEINNATDMQVRGEFTELIANFVRTVAKKGPVDSAAPTALFGAIKTGATSFIRIGAKAEVAHDFRFCELSLWGAKLPHEKTESCAFLVDQLAALNTITSNLTDVLGLGGNGKGLLGGLLGPARPKKKKSTGLLGL